VSSGRNELSGVIEALQRRLVELSAAEAGGRDLKAQAKQRLLKAREASDRQKAEEHWNQAEIFAEKLHEAAEAMAALYCQMTTELVNARALIIPHVLQNSYSLYKVPDIDVALKLAIHAAGGPDLGGELRALGLNYNAAPPSLGCMLVQLLDKQRKRLASDLPAEEPDAPDEAEAA
jgi:hypothetical protein